MKTACIVYMLWYILHVTYVAMAFLYSSSLHVSWAVLSKTPQATPSVNVADHAMVWLASSPVILLLIIMIMSVDVMLITLSISNMHQTFLEEKSENSVAARTSGSLRPGGRKHIIGSLIVS